MRNEVARAFQRAKTPITERSSKQVRHPNITTNPPPTLAFLSASTTQHQGALHPKYAAHDRTLRFYPSQPLTTETLTTRRQDGLRRV
jgi:hypothetical protein